MITTESSIPNMRNYLSIASGLLLLLSLSCTSSKKIEQKNHNEPVIATFADETITIDDLKTNFYRNRTPGSADTSQIEEFFPSYINYRLKLYEGYQRGYDQDSTVQAEFNEYASEIAYRYWIENDIKKDRIKTFKERFESELKAFHILKELSQDALPQDTADVYNSLIAVRDSLLNGASPEEMNERHSSKRNDNPVGGQLSWFTAGSTIQPFEDAVYSFEPGEISMPVRTQFGYHLIILQDIRPRTPQRLVKHIFIRKSEDETGSQKIQLAYEALEADSSWSEVLHKYTEDPSTRNNDGLLGWVGYGTRFPAELIESAMSTNPDSVYSVPFEVSYGYHIMKIDSVRTFQSEDQKEGFIVDRLEQLGRLEPGRDDVFERIASETGLKINRLNFASLSEQTGPSDNENRISSNNELIYFNGKSYANEDFQEWLNQEASVDEVMESGDLITSYRNHIIRKNLVDITRQHFPDFSEEVDHFLEGLIVFEVNQNHIWDPESVDRNELKSYYESNKNKYRKGKTFIYTEISAASDSLIRVAYQKLEEGLEMSEISESFDDVTVYEDSTSHPQHPAFVPLESLSIGEFSKPVSVNDREFIYLKNETKPERMLSFEEAFDMVFSDYQPIHEEKFLNHLKERYNLETYPDNIQ